MQWTVLRRSILSLGALLLAVAAAPVVTAQETIESRLVRGGTFKFTKLDFDGRPLANQDAIYTITPWDCVRDEVTGLVWEVKTVDGGLRDQNHLYTWYNPNPEENGGAPGTRDGGVCAGDIKCDTRSYVAAVNRNGLCGADDWRLPTRAELRTIVDYKAEFPAIDTSYFANTVARSFWTDEANETYPNFAWHTDFKFGLASYYYYKSGAKAVRLVRGGR